MTKKVTTKKKEGALASLMADYNGISSSDEEDLS
jgi:hypothetical protein